MFANVPAYFQGAGRWAAIALGASIPISVALDNALFLVLLLAWLFGGGLREKLERVRESPAALVALAFLGLLILGMAWGPGSAREGWQSVLKHKDLVLVAVLGGIVAGGRDKRLALHAFLLAMALTLAASYAIWLGLLPVEETPGRGRANPTAFKLHITHGFLMALAAFLAADRAVRSSDTRWRVIYGAGALLAACNVFMVQGRTGYLVFGVLALYFCLAHWRWRGAGALAGVAVVALGTALLTDANALRRVTTTMDESAGPRMNYYRTTMDIVREYPLAGVGTGGFERAYRAKDRDPARSEVSNNPHNQYLLTTAQLGVLGLGALLAMFGVMWWQARRLDAEERIAARALVLAIAVGCTFNSFLIDHAEGLLFAWMAGVLFATSRTGR